MQLHVGWPHVDPHHSFVHLFKHLSIDLFPVNRNHQFVPLCCVRMSRNGSLLPSSGSVLNLVGFICSLKHCRKASTLVHKATTNVSLTWHIQSLGLSGALAWERIPCTCWQRGDVSPLLLCQFAPTNFCGNGSVSTLGRHQWHMML